MQALGMQAEHQEKQAGSEDGTLASEGAPDLDHTWDSWRESRNG